MSKLTEGEQTLTYAKVADLLRAAYRAKAKTSDDPVHEEVAITVYCGAGFNVGITATGYEDPDAAGKVCFYVSQQYEDDIGEMNMGGDLKQAIKGLFEMASDVSEMEDRVYIDDAEVKKLEDLSAGQGFLFENLKTMERISESKKLLKEGKFKSAQINFNEFINKLQQFLDTAAPGMGLEVVEQNLGMGGAFIKIEQRDENGKAPDDGFESWLDSDDYDEYEKVMGE
jgi:hypothetical protein